MEPISAFLIYLAAHRVMMFMAGIISIVLGYRLLRMGLSGSGTPEGKPREEVLSAQVGSAKFAMRNLAPGTAFAFFGAAMLTSVALHGPPEIKLDSLGEGRTRAEFRGDEQVGRQGEFGGRAIRLLGRGDVSGALGLAREANRKLAIELNDLAWVLVKAKADTQVAVSFSEAAVAADPTNANYLDTLAQAFLASGRHDAAVQALERANQLDPKYRADLDRLKAVSRAK